MHGAPRNVTWTQVQRTALAGDTVVSLSEVVDWSVGDQVVISTTGHNAWHTEVHTIQALDVTKTKLTLTNPLEHKHLGESELTWNHMTIRRIYSLI